MAQKREIMNLMKQQFKEAESSESSSSDSSMEKQKGIPSAPDNVAMAKELAILRLLKRNHKQKTAFQQKLEVEKKKFEENKAAHESMLRSLQSTNRESVIGREEAQSKINEMEQKFLQERKKQEETYNEYRKTLTDQVENLKKKNNELELQVKVAEGEFQKDVQQLKE